jgi:phenylalanyl-tRNA synthetase alpha chain
MSRPDVEALLLRFREDLSAAALPDDVQETKRRHLGKKSPLKALLAQVRDVPPEERGAFAAAINRAQQDMEREVEARAAEVEAKALSDRLDQEWMDLTLPGVATRRGARHPVAEVERRSLEMLRQLGFVLVDGPEVEEPYYNFDALNIPEHHPARDMQDTFWVEGGLVLRTHTTSVQARVLAARPPLPIKIASAGRVYRNEAVDATHLAMFHQLEGLWVEPGLTFAHLKGILAFVARTLYGDQPVRFKPKFYPYTEPSVGCDLRCVHCHGDGCDACHGAGWITILGAGMVHPKVFLEFGYDPATVSGIAFGLGTTRMAGQWSGVHKIRDLYDADLRVYRALHRGGGR